MTPEHRAAIAESQVRRQATRPGWPDPPRRCPRCKETRPARMFAHLGTKPSGMVRRGRDCDLCRERTRKRPPKVNAAGDVRCSHCARYLPSTSFRWLDPPSFKKPRWAAYCTPCQRELDRLRWTGDRRERLNKRRLVNQRKQQQATRQEKNDFGVNAILALRKRGLTKRDIVALVGISRTLLLDVEARRCRVTTPLAERFRIALLETSHLPTGSVPAFRRRKPLPGLDELVARVRPLMDGYPLRSRWKGNG